jgi:predicted homoserine dehydrogenase-like protein
MAGTSRQPADLFLSVLMPPTFSATQQPKVGVSGTGFIARGLLAALAHSEEFQIARVLTRRPVDDVEGVDRELLTRSVEQFVESCDIVAECSGSVRGAAEVVAAAHRAGRPVVTMGTEFHVTIGSYFCDSGYLTEAEGDQPGSLAAHAEEVISMGFKPLVYGNIKGYLNHNPIETEMEYWAERNGISVEQTISFTDGTKMQMEQVLVANGLGASIARRGMLGPETIPLEVSGAELARQAKNLNCTLSDYVLNRSLPAGVFVVGEHAYAGERVLRYFKLGDGPFYTLLRPYHLCHLEMIKTLRRVVEGRPPLLNNTSSPRCAAAAVVKRPLPSGHLIARPFGGYDTRGEAVMIADEPDAVPIGILEGARLTRPVEPGQTLVWGDVEIPPGPALDAAIALRDKSAANIA